MRPTTLDHDRHLRLLAIALLWLSGGSLLLLSTLVPARTALLGWAPTLWLLVVPLVLLLALEPGLPMRLLGRRSRRRRSRSAWR